MKRNMLAIVILAATLINLTLSAVLIFTIVPKAQRTDELIKKIVSAIELETESGIGTNYGEIAPEDQEEYVFQQEYVNLKPIGDEANVAMANITITLNKKHEDYATVQPLIESKKTKIVAAVSSVLSDYVAAEVPTYTEDINKDALEKVREIFQSKCVIEVTLHVYGGK
ncbi:MAG: hypothetical protein IJ427_00015 [Lachnospiraceae bacterium]|nr:hypothetical protein [Lachnospiraceae bacterium]MBQ8846635.1 hypothetical protein [Lachnospiraceae bacterium]